MKRDEIEKAALEFIPEPKVEVLGGYRTKMATVLMADFALEHESRVLAKVAAELREFHTLKQTGFAKTLCEIGGCKICDYIAKLESPDTEVEHDD